MVNIPQKMLSFLTSGTGGRQVAVDLSLTGDSKDIAGQMLRGELVQVAKDGLAKLATAKGRMVDVLLKEPLPVGTKITSLIGADGKAVRSTAELPLSQTISPAKQNQAASQPAARLPFPVGQPVSVLVPPTGDGVVLTRSGTAQAIPRADLPLPPQPQTQQLTVVQGPSGQWQAVGQPQALAALSVSHLTKGYNIKTPQLNSPVGTVLPAAVNQVASHGKVYHHDLRISMPQAAQVSGQSGLTHTVSATAILPEVIPKGAEMSIQITKPGVSDILEVVKDMPTDAKFNKGPGSERQAFLLPDDAPHAPRPLKDASAAPAKQPTLQPGMKLAGAVVAQKPEGQVVIALHNNQTLTVKAPEPLPVGAALSLQVTDSGDVAVTGLSIPPAVQESQAVSRLIQQWDTLSLALRALGGAGRENALPIPALNNNPAAALVLFAAAVFDGQAERWVGPETAQLLQTLGADLAPDFQQLQQFSRSEGADGWRALFFPFVGDDPQTPDQAALFWKKQPDDQPARRHLRFVINLDLASLGPLQLEGMLDGKHMALKLRSHQPLPDGLQRALTGVVENTLTAVGLTGGIVLDVTNRFETEPLAAMLVESHQFNVTV